MPRSAVLQGGSGNFKLIFLLSLLGLAMAFATVFYIPATIEPFCWLVLFLICAYIIAKQASARFFLHGLMVSIVNSVWITAAHVLFFDQYIAKHAKEAQAIASVPLAPKAMMAVTGPIIGVLSGLVLGLFAFLAAKLVRRAPAQRAA